MIVGHADAPVLLDYWGIALYDLGLSEKQFWQLTPALLSVLCRRKVKEDRRRLANSALIAATLINLHRPKGKQPVNIADIIGPDIAADSKEASPEELLTLMKIFHKTGVNKTPNK